uniref:(California timema) hypothetical protein n=1 Tax=Timema californicum TaxID=61474 RepID=A0A7R9JDZ7_TIMCA|nr:unnamed protein product [Timema californicum]
MTLFSALRALPDMEVVGLNFSSATTPELLLKTFDHYCEYRKTPNGVVLSPVQLGKWLVLFCDEINLPDMDQYGTQRVISFLRQLVEHRGFFRASDQAWVSLERIQFVGACNPPTDPGRKPLSHRFLRHVPVIYIYGTFSRAMLRLIPPLRGYAEPLTNAMVEFYLASQERFTQDMQPHYVYSPREMTRWVRGICEAIRPIESLNAEGLVRLWAHEALRLFQDRLVEDTERRWTNDNIDVVALKHFPGVDKEASLARPILYSNWLSKNYIPVNREELRDYVKARLKVFYEEELDVPLVLFDEVLDHVLRIDRIFRQPQGHLLLIGVSGAGKTTLSRFVAWMNGLSIFQIKVHNKYTGEDFDEDLRAVLRRSGCKDEKIAFILDESNVLDSGDEYTTLMTQCKEGAQREGLMLDSNEELYKWFTGQVMRNLHVVFTMNPSSEGLKDRAATSPALFNRCVLNWFGDWSDGALFQVGREFTNRVDLDRPQWKAPDFFPAACTIMPATPTHRDAVINACVYVHQTLHKANARLAKRGGRTMAITPRHYLDFINHFVKLYNEKRSDLEEQQLHLNVGLNKIAETVEQVEEMQKSLAVKSQELQAKNEAANAKLRQMVKDQQEAEKKKVQSQEIQGELEVQTVKIGQKREDVMADLAQVEPAVIDAQAESYSSHIRPNPPPEDLERVGVQEIIKEARFRWFGHVMRMEKERLPKIMMGINYVGKRLQGTPRKRWEEQITEGVLEEKNRTVKSIKKQHLVEVRSMANPPAIVKVALESICLLLGENATEWRTIRSVTMRENFISTIVNFNTEELTFASHYPFQLYFYELTTLSYDEIRCSCELADSFAHHSFTKALRKIDLMNDDVREKMKSRYLSNPDYNFEKVNRASMACGPMVKWAIAQINYADMLKRVEPLRDELHSLEVQADENKHRGEEVTDLITQLEHSIAAYKEEYAQLISQAQAIKTDLENVQAKVDRSIALLKSLCIERERWEATSETFRSQMSTIIGDVLLSSAFLAYAGYFDQHYRQNLFATWCHHLQQAALQFRADIARTEYLSNPDERLRWQANALPTDDLCTENAIMLKRFNRYPLIIDPSGQATEFILNEFRDKKITKTSFLDDSFRKNLESALRFGNPLLVQDVENYDPILNPVLNRELRRTGGRVLITLGDQDIDLSPSFVIFLSTRDPTVEFPPDICSRVTFVNFTVTRSSLQSQCLNQVLKSERPDIDEKRSDLLKLQGEFHLRLRQLEKSLLQALNDAKGKILDDDSVITTLETLKQEAADISKKVEETDKVIGEIETVSQQYMPLSQACSNIYFTMDSLNQIHFLYQYSLKFFLDIFSSVLLSNPKLSNTTDYGTRLAIITRDLFGVCYERVARGMLHTDRLTFALLLCRIHLKGVPGEVSLDQEFTFFLRGKEGMLTSKPPSMEGLNTEQLEALFRLSTRLQAFSKLAQHIQEMPEIGAWLQQGTPEQCVPKLWEEEKQLSLIGTAMYQLLAFRPDRVIAAGQLFVSAVLGEDFMPAAEKELDLASNVETELRANVPALLCSVPGFDASGRVDDLAAELSKPIASIAIGSAEGFNQADRAINLAVKSGRWVMLKNVHLAPQWLVQLEKKLHSLQPHAAFRLFLTMEINPKVPYNLLRAGRIFVFEPPPGIRANLLRTFSTEYHLFTGYLSTLQVPASRMMKAPTERARLYFLLAWFHAIVQERLRYVPLGWAKYYEFNESDLRVACDTLDTWIEATAMGRTNLPPEKVPWDALVTLLSQCIYGGKIDNDYDQRLLASFLSKLFTPRSFEGDFALVANVDGVAGGPGGQRHITMPDGNRRDHFLHWIESLADRQTPSWLGLPNNAEKVLLTTRGTDLVSKLLKMQQLEDDDELAYSVDEGLDKPHEQKGDGRPSWMRTLNNSASTWLNLLPKSLQTLRRTVDNIKDPLYRYFEREVNSGAKLLQDVIHDLDDVVLICRGEKKQTNYHRNMLSELVKGILPASWRRYTVPRGCTVIQWITDFSQRIKQLQETFDVWLGGLLNPEAYITATRQCIAQANSWSLEELLMEVTITEASEGKQSIDDCSFGVVGLKLQGATSRNNQLLLTSTIMMDLPVTYIRWIRSGSGSEVSRSGKLSLPVYLNSTRTELLFTVDLNIAPGQDHHSFYERGVAVLTSTALN